MFHTHALEKGLSHTDVRLGFGRSAISALVLALEAYRLAGHPKDNETFVCALSTLHEYEEQHQQASCSSPLRDLAPDWLVQELRSCTSTSGGVQSVACRTPSAVDCRTFSQVVYSRHSVREFGKTPVSKEMLHESIRMARRSPSVCNRQAVSVHIEDCPATINSLLAIQGGFNGYPTPPKLLVITADLRAFLDPTERNQAYIDGGLFSMTLLLALESFGFAACALNAMMRIPQE